MVAYSFAPMFAHQVATLIKRQTVRADRPRHARQGEAVQLYAGMRTRQCRKLVDPDPVCTKVQRIEIAVSSLIDVLVASIAIDGIPLTREEIETFARDDGFAPELLGASTPFPIQSTARANMGQFWQLNHGTGLFHGVLVRWEPQL